MKYSDQAYNNRMDERRAAGILIDPAMAGIEWCWGLTLDPYHDGFEMPPECRQIGRVYFARAPGSDIRVHFGDLPDATRDAIWNRIDKGEISDDTLEWLFE